MEAVSVEVRGLTKRFGPIVAVDDLSFAVAPGLVTGFLGPNGAGKTTTLRMLLGLVTPTTGTALVNGVAYRDLDDPTRTVGAVLEATGFHPARSARNHLRTIAVVDGIASSRVDEVLEMVGLADAADRKVGGFSLGMRQRLELARALLGDPPILVLDEPANGLDPQGIAWMRGFLRWYASLGRIVLVSSHLLAEAAQTVDDVVIVAAGRLAASGSLPVLLQGTTTSVRVRTPDAARLAAVVAHAGLAARTEGHDVVVTDGTTAEVVGPLMAAHGIVVYEMTSTGESLEQLFFEMTDGERGAVVKGQVRSEALKLRTVWSTALLLALAVGLVLLLALFIAFVHPHGRHFQSALQPARGSIRWFDNIFSTMDLAQDLTLVLGVLVVTGEYRHQTVTPTYLAEPRRGRVTGAKLFVSGLGGLALALAVGAVGLAFGFILVALGNGTAATMLGQYRHIIPGVLGAAVLFALYGSGLGALLKNQVVAIVVGLGFSFVVEPIVELSAPQAAKYLPAYAAQALSGTAARGISRVIPLLTWWEGTLALLVYGLVLAVAGSLTTLRADVT